MRPGKSPFLAQKTREKWAPGLGGCGVGGEERLMKSNASPKIFLVLAVLMISAGVVLLALLSGLAYFQKMETTMADVV